MNVIYNIGPSIPPDVLAEAKRLNARFRGGRLSDRRTRGGKFYAEYFARLIRGCRPDLADIVYSLAPDELPIFELTRAARRGTRAGEDAPMAKKGGKKPMKKGGGKGC